MVSTRKMTTCWILSNWISGKMCFTYNAGSCMMMHCSNQVEPLWIGYAARETKPDWPLMRHNLLHDIIEHPVMFFSTKSWLKTLNLQQLNCQIRTTANKPRSDPGQTQVRPGSDLDQLLSSPSCAINGKWLLWETPPLNNRLEFTIEEMPHRQPQQDMVEFLGQKTPSGAFMPYRKVHVDSLLRSMTDTVDIGYVQDKQAHTGS